MIHHNPKSNNLQLWIANWNWLPWFYSQLDPAVLFHLQNTQTNELQCTGVKFNKISNLVWKRNSSPRLSNFQVNPGTVNLLLSPLSKESKSNTLIRLNTVFIRFNYSTIKKSLQILTHSQTLIEFDTTLMARVCGLYSQFTFSTLTLLKLYFYSFIKNLNW